MARKKKIPVPDKPSLLSRVHALLPYVLFAAVGFNLWFVFSYVRRERVSVDGVQDRVLSSVSNALVYVHSSLSNDIAAARQAFSNEVTMFRARTMALSTPLFDGPSSGSFSVSSNSVVEFKSFPPVPSGDVSGYSFVCSGRACVCVDGSYYQVGDDFGYGPIDRITKLFVVCGGRYYRLISGSFRPSFPSDNFKTLALGDTPNG